MGTVRYMSPEQLREMPVDQRTDIWSLGAVLYEMLTGTSPFAALTPNDTIALILGKQPTEFKFADGLPVEFQQLIKKALTKDRDERYQTVEELASDLKKVRREFRRRSEIDGTPEPVTQSSLNLDQADNNERPMPTDTHRRTKFFRLKSQAISTADFSSARSRNTKPPRSSRGSLLSLPCFSSFPICRACRRGLIV